METPDKNLVNFLFEVGMLKVIHRTGFPFLGSGKESVAAHSFRVAMIGYVLAWKAKADREKVVTLCLMHDLQETRTGDLNYIQKRYVRADEKKAFREMTEDLPFCSELQGAFEEYHTIKTKEAALACDADQLDLLFELKKAKDLGNPYASRWIKYLQKRLVTREGKVMAGEILKTDWAQWWLSRAENFRKFKKEEI